MKMSYNEMITLKMNLLGGMYTYLGQDECAYEEWIERYSDQPSEEDLREIAEDETEWKFACGFFGRLVKRYDLRNIKEAF